MSEYQELPLDTRAPYYGSWRDWVWNRERQAGQDADDWTDEELPDRIFSRLKGGWTPPPQPSTGKSCPRCHSRPGGCRHYATEEEAMADFRQACQ